jgi:hypothetical protein
MVSHPDDNGHDDQPTCRSRRHEPGKAPLRASGIQICSICRDLAESALIELPELFELCAHALDLRPNGPRERVSGNRPHGIVLRDAVVTARSDILGVLAAWCGLVTTERGVLGPDELDIRKLVGFLAIHLHWLCQHLAAPDFVDELTDLTDAATQAMRQESTGFRVAAGTCLRGDCDRTVYAEAHREGTEPYEVSCEAGHVWAPEHWLSLRGKPTGPNDSGHHGDNGNGHSGNGHSSNGHGGNGTGNNGHVQVNGHADDRSNGHSNGSAANSRPVSQAGYRRTDEANSHANGHLANQADHQINGHTNGQLKGHPADQADGPGNRKVNGHTNDLPTGLPNGHANGRSPRPPNGHSNGHVNGRAGQVNGRANGHPTTQINGHSVDGQAGGHSPGSPNGYPSGRRSPSAEGAE